VLKFEYQAAAHLKVMKVQFSCYY